MIKLSVVIPLFNSERYIIKTLNSILNQTLPKEEYEIIVYDDFSTDNSLYKVETSLDYKNIILLKGKINHGASFARNRAIEIAKSNLIVAFDSDDVLYKNSLETILNYSKKDSPLAFGYSSYDLINEQGDFISHKKIKPFSSQNLLHFNVTGPGLMFFTKYSWNKINGFDETLKFAAVDWDFVLRMDEKFKENEFVQIRETLFSYRRRSDSLSNISYKTDPNLEVLERTLSRRGINFKQIKKISPHKLNSYYYEYF